MTRTQFGTLLNLTTKTIPVGKKNRPQTLLTPTYITVHNTDNKTAGANALAHANFLINTGFYYYPKNSDNKIWVSWHYTIDDNKIYKHLPANEMAFHAKANGNAKSLGIEICMHNGINQNEAFNRAANLIAALMYDYNIPIEKVVTHYKWTGKKCPSLFLEADGSFGNKWNNFKRKIVTAFNTIN
jgi:N-acetylmuramoyl-L-alanine amidase CwlA